MTIELKEDNSDKITNKSFISVNVLQFIFCQGNKINKYTKILKIEFHYPLSRSPRCPLTIKSCVLRK